MNVNRTCSSFNRISNDMNTRVGSRGLVIRNTSIDIYVDRSIFGIFISLNASMIVIHDG